MRALLSEAVQPAMFEKFAASSSLTLARLSSFAEPSSSRRTEDRDAVRVVRMASGDEGALAELYDAYGATTYSLALAVVKDSQDAEDVVARTFAQLWRGAASFDAARGTVGAWITMTARSRALDLLRTRKRELRLLERASTEVETGFAAPQGGMSAVASDEAEQNETAELVRASLASLTFDQRNVIALAFFEGLSHSEVAARINEPLGTVKTRIRTGLQRLRAALAPTLGKGAP